MITAALITVLFHRLKQPVVLGYIVAGAIIGPHTPPFSVIHDTDTIKTLSELGIVLLMFSIGMEFSLKKLKKVGATAFIAASLEILLMMWIGYEIGVMFGWGKMDSIFLGAILSISSSTIIIKALQGLGKNKEHFAEYVLGILIVEDILAIVILALLSGVAVTGDLAPLQIAGTVTQLAIFLVVVLVLGLIAVPRFIQYVAGFKDDEVLLVTMLGLCFGVSLLAAKLGYSIALGAFLIGAVIAECRQILKLEELLKPVRDMFSAIFFVSIGLLIEPRLLVEHFWAIVVIALAVIIGKVLTCSFGTFVAGHNPQTSLRVGMSLAQIGEFSFIIAAMGMTLEKNKTSDFLYPITVTVSVLTTLTTPYLIRAADPTVHWLEKHLPPATFKYLDFYTRWVEELFFNKENNPLADVAKRLLVDLGLLALLIAAIFISATFLDDFVFRYWPHFPGGMTGASILAWLGAMTFSSFLYVASFRKLEALGILCGELCDDWAPKEEDSLILKRFINGAILVVGCSFLTLMTLAFTSSILPPSNLLLLLVLITATVVVFFRNKLAAVYAAGQVAITNTLNQPKDHPHSGAPGDPMLKGGSLVRIEVPAGAAVHGKNLAALRFRAVTGANIAGVDRAGAARINPGPDCELRTGDQVLVFGEPEHVEAARKLLTEKDS